MNEHEMADLLDRATRDLAPDVESLVAAGLRRGRHQQRRRRDAGAVATTVVAVVAIGLGSQLLHTGSPGVDPGVPGPSAVTPLTSPMTSAPTPPKARLAVTTEQVPTTFAQLEPGAVSAPSAKSGPDSAPVVDFTWNGFGIRVGLTPDDYVTGRSVVDPARRCAEQSGGASCRPGPDGTVVATSSATNPEVDGGTKERSVWVFRPDGWDVLVVAYNGAAKAGPVTADEPPFSLQELQQIASSDVWFR